MSILIVDDSKDDRVFLKTILEHRGLGELFTAGSSQEAFACLEHADRIKLVLLDVMMPGMDGIETLRRMKDEARWRDIPVIMVTGQNDLSNLETAFAAGATDYVTKPFKKVELIARISAALRLKREMDQRKRHELELEQALREIRVLRGFIPICASCKKIRDDKGYWQQVETYISKHSGAEFTHGICPECMDRLYPEAKEEVG